MGGDDREDSPGREGPRSETGPTRHTRPLAVELDLFETHGSRAAFERDRRRQEELKLLGIEMIRITKPRLDREPDAVIRNLAALLERRRAELGLAQRA